MWERLYGLSSSFRYIVRMAGKDLDGTRKVIPALAEIKGIGERLASVIVNALRIDPMSRFGNLTDQQISALDDCMRNPSKNGIPVWLVNRRKDPETGLDHHVIGADLDLSVRTDVTNAKAVGSWRGVRHSLGLKVRGQRTRTTGRKAGALGVKKVAAAPATAPQKP